MKHVSYVDKPRLSVASANIPRLILSVGDIEMASLNKVMIIGNLGRDPETRYMPSGDAMTTIAVATTETWKDKQTGERKKRPNGIV